MNKYLIILFASLFIVACENFVNFENESEKTFEKDHHGHEDSHEEVRLSVKQFDSLELKVNSLPLRNMTSFVEANGQLEVPPQNEAAVTAIIGANINSISVIEGDKVNKWQTLAYLSHPDLIEIQTQYLNKWNELQYLENDYFRQKKLFEENVGSGKKFQKISAEYEAASGKVKGYEAQLKLLGLNI